MAILNRTTLKQKLSDFINRVGAFNGNPLVQKSEDLEVREDVVDSMLTREADSFSINNPTANISIDFSNGQVCQVDSGASIETVFNITFSNLRANEFGKIVFTKKSNDVYSFANAKGTSPIDPKGKTLVDMFVFNTGSGFVVMEAEDRPTLEKVVRLNWDMDNVNNLLLGNFEALTGVPVSRIVSLDISVRSNDDTKFYGIPYVRLTTQNNAIEWEINGSSLTLKRATSGDLDSASFSNAEVIILIKYDK